jgi:plasmid stabilization system protein ParE
MSRQKTEITLSVQAEADLANIAAWTADNYGPQQAEIYIDAILDTIDELSMGEPVRSPSRSNPRDEIAIGL